VAEEPGVELQRVQPRLFGSIPPLGLLGSGGLLFVAAIALLPTGHWVIGTVVLLLALLLFGLYLLATRRLPASQVRQRAVGGIWRARDELRFAGSSARAWTSAAAACSRSSASCAGWHESGTRPSTRSAAPSTGTTGRPQASSTTG
jgi:hypothetical protein